MGWVWEYLDEAGDATGTSQDFDSRGDAETWLGQEFGTLLDDGATAARLLDDGAEKYVMGLGTA